MPDILLRAVRPADLDALVSPPVQDDPFGFFDFVATNAMHRAYATDGLLGDTFGILMIETPAHETAGYVGWSVTQYGPVATARARNIGIYLFPAFRGRGLGAAAQLALARHTFDTTLFERVEAFTDVENHAEQRALERAGFTREGVARHAQYRAGGWHDLVLYSRLRGD